MFNVQSNANAAPLTSKQKFQLFFKSSTDWYQFAITAIDGGLSLLGKEYPSYGEGGEGFAKYWGAAYADTFDGNLWGNAILTSWWKEDPRYYRMGHGNFFKRAGYSAVTTVWCKRDKGTWGPNYANVAGNFIGGTISNLYYPANDRGVELTLGRGASVTYEGIVGAEIAEFWPDIVHSLHRRSTRRSWTSRLPRKRALRLKRLRRNLRTERPHQPSQLRSRSNSLPVTNRIAEPGRVVSLSAIGSNPWKCLAGFVFSCCFFSVFGLPHPSQRRLSFGRLDFRRWILPRRMKLA